MLLLTIFLLLYLEISHLFPVAVGRLWTVVPMNRFLYSILVMTVRDC